MPGKPKKTPGRPARKKKPAAPPDPPDPPSRSHYLDRPPAACEPLPADGRHTDYWAAQRAYLARLPP